MDATVKASPHRHHRLWLFVVVGVKHSGCLQTAAKQVAERRGAGPSSVEHARGERGFELRRQVGLARWREEAF